MAEMHSLRPYQVEAIAEIERAWERGERSPLIVMATGTGKTSCFAEVIRRHYARTGVRSLVLAHRIELIDQAAARLTATGVVCEVESGDRRASRLGALFGCQAVVATVQTMRGRRLGQWPQDSFSLIVIDECFVSSTTIDTPRGPRPIGETRAGDDVLSWDDASCAPTIGTVLGVWSRPAPDRLIRISVGGTEVICTPNHPWRTARGWARAADLTCADIVLQSHDASALSDHVRRLRERRGEAETPDADVQMRPVPHGMEGISAHDDRDAVRLVRGDGDRGGPGRECSEGAGSDLLRPSMFEGVRRTSFCNDDDGDESKMRGLAHADEQPHAPRGRESEDGSESARDRSRAEDTQRERAWPDACAAGDRRRAGMADGGGGGRGPWPRERVADGVQDRCGERRAEDRDRDRRILSLCAPRESVRREEGCIPSFARVDRVEILERGRDGEYERVCPDGLVWNIEVAGTHTYSVASCVVHNCHRATAQLYRDVLDWFPAAKVLGVTATPDRGDGVAVGDVFTAGAVFEYGIRDGILGGFLCDIRAKTIDLDRVTIDGVRTSRQEHGRDLRTDDLAKAMAGEECMHAIAAPLAREAGERSTLVFMPSVELTHELARVLAGYVGADKVRSLDGSSDPDDRKAAIDAYQRGEVQYLINCALFTEGFDAPRTSCVAVARPTKSRALYTQMVGRGTRLYPGKTDLLVLDFFPANTRHDLAKVVDIFDGEPLDPQAEKLRDDAIKSGETVLKATEEAKRLAREAEEKRARERERADLAIRATYEARERQLWSVASACGITAGDYAAPPMRDDQRARMEALKIEIDSRETVRTASAKIMAVTRRRREGLCTLKQAKVLARAGLNPDLTFDAAIEAIDALAANRWRVDGSMVSRWGKPRAA